jgi:hypothetical protein
MNNKDWKIEPTQYEGLYKHIAPTGYEFWCGEQCYGNVVWGNYILENHYELKKKE